MEPYLLVPYAALLQAWKDIIAMKPEEIIKKELISRPVAEWESAKSFSECEQIIKNNLRKLEVWDKQNPPVIIMCPPTFYNFEEGDSVPIFGNGFVVKGYVEFHNDKNGNIAKIHSEWQALQEILNKCGARVINIKPTNAALTGQVYTADPAQSYVFVNANHDEFVESHSLTIFSHFRNPSRRDEAKAMIEFYDTLKRDSAYTSLFRNRINTNAHYIMEGNGDNLLDPYRGIIVSGYGVRNESTSLSELEKLTGLPVYGVESKEPFFHIDTYCSILPNGYVLYAPEVMTDKGLQQLEYAFFKNSTELKEKYAITVSKEDAENFVCNAVIIGQNIIMQPCCDALKKTLLEKGFVLTFTAAQVANYGGGGLHCMTNKFNQPVISNYNYTTAQFIRNLLMNSKSKETILKILDEKFPAQDIKHTYDTVEMVCNDAAKKIQSQFRFWKTQNSIESRPAGKMGLQRGGLQR